MEDYFAYTAKLFNPAEGNQKPEILKGIRVLDFSHVIFGPTATRIMAQYGAEVIKIELPFQGDLWRPATYWGKYWKHSNPLWHFVTQNKYFLGVDLKKPEAKKIIYQLAETADVVAENFAPGTAEAWGVGYTKTQPDQPQDRLPELLHLRAIRAFTVLSGLGSSGPGRQRGIESDRLSRYG